MKASAGSQTFEPKVKVANVDACMRVGVKLRR